MTNEPARREWTAHLTVTEDSLSNVAGVPKLVKWHMIGVLLADSDAVTISPGVKYQAKVNARDLLSKLDAHLGKVGVVLTTADDLDAIGIVANQLIDANERLSADANLMASRKADLTKVVDRLNGDLTNMRRARELTMVRANTADRRLKVVHEEKVGLLKRQAALEQEIERIRSDKESLGTNGWKDRAEQAARELAVTRAVSERRAEVEGAEFRKLREENARLEADNQVLTTARDAVMRDNELLRKRRAVLQDQLAATYEQVGTLQREQSRVTPGNLGRRLLVMAADCIVVVCERHGRLYSVEPNLGESVDEVVKGHRDQVGCSSSITLSAAVESHHSGTTTPPAEL